MEELERNTDISGGSGSNSSNGLEVDTLLLEESEYDEYGYCPDIIDTELEEESSGAFSGKKGRRRKKQVRTKHYDRGYRNIIMTLLLTAGAIPYSSIDMLPGEHRMYLRKLRIMSDEKIIELIRNNSKKIARLNKCDDSDIVELMPHSYQDYYSNYGKKNQDKINTKDKNGTTAERSIRSCEVIAMMFGAGIGVTCEDKPDLVSEKKIADGMRCYYTMHELRDCKDFALYIKPEDKEKEHNMTSRILGLLISAGGKYPVYHTGKNALLWRSTSEGQMAYYISQLVHKKCEVPNMSGSATECIIIGQSMDVFLKIFRNKKKGSLSMENGYQYMYAIPYDQNGQMMLNQMTRPNWKKELNRKILIGYDTDIRDGVLCDGLKDNITALNFCNGDITRLKRFLSTLNWHSKMQETIYKIYCYDFQYDFLKAIVTEVADDLAEIVVVDAPIAEYLIKLKKG